MAGWSYHNPVAIGFGAGCLNGLGDRIGNRRAVVLTFPEAAGLGLVERLRRLLGARLDGVLVAEQSNPDVDGLDGLYATFWREHAAADVIVAVGGGSVIDAAKVLMAGTADGSLQPLVEALAGGTAFVPQRRKALIAVPTTAGTGSEVTRWATLWHRAAGRKYSLDSAAGWPEAALVDAELSLSLPPAPTLAAGLDALSHALEAIWNVHANPVSDAYAVRAAREVLATLPYLMARPRDLALRERMAHAALTAGLAFSNTRTALAHSISYELTLAHGVPHGIACSFSLPLVLARAIGVDSDRDAVLAKVFSGSLERAPDFLEAFLARLGVSTRFESYGVSAAASTRLVEAALEGPRGRNFIGAGAGAGPA